MILAAVCLANTDGGVIYLGVEDDGTPTGLHDDHRDISGLTAMIANRTIPPLSVRADAGRAWRPEAGPNRDAAFHPSGRHQ